MVKRYVINKRKWRFLRVALRDIKGPNGEKYHKDGDCDPPEKRNRAMRVHKRLTGKKELKIILHEAKHAECHEMFDEAYVEDWAEDMADFLWDIGYRKVDPN